ncbi:hypothetical protein [Rhizobium rhizosphaerae]|uniref:hypothetical protein n=1 Tax=Xaviernesmea rhizosphaerae TaxID=1672749 RepID=UPI00117AAEBA|nr:hypothetical protein [Xaviernesmea rhizosphaerae]
MPDTRGRARSVARVEKISSAMMRKGQGRHEDNKKGRGEIRTDLPYSLTHPCQYIRGQQFEAMIGTASLREFGWDAQPAVPMSGCIDVDCVENKA